MEFTHTDIIQLYGKQFFIIPEKVEGELPTVEMEEIQPSESTVSKVPMSSVPNHLNQGVPIIWRMKSHAQMALILQQNEFANRDLTAALKSYIMQAEIPTEAVGFGVIPEACEACDCSDMAVKVGIVFKLFGEKLPSPVEVDGKHLFVVADLALISSKEAFQTRLIQVLQQAYQLTQS